MYTQQSTGVYVMHTHIAQMAMISNVGRNCIIITTFQIIISCNHNIFYHPTALPVTIGIQQTAYTVTEVDDYQLVCFEVLSGDIDGREIVIDYSTASGTASMYML